MSVTSFARLELPRHEAANSVVFSPFCPAYLPVRSGLYSVRCLRTGRGHLSLDILVVPGEIPLIAVPLISRLSDFVRFAGIDYQLRCAAESLQSLVELF
jgi:hypothetical protein